MTIGGGGVKGGKKALLTPGPSEGVEKSGKERPRGVLDASVRKATHEASSYLPKGAWLL